MSGAGWPGGEPFVRACGDELDARVEEDAREERVDHVWITMRCGAFERVVVAVNTLSLRSREAGCDARLRVGRLAGSCQSLPAPGWSPAEAFDYTEFEASHNVFYETLERPAVERLLLDLTSRACCLECRGAPFRRKGRMGIHQVHSRRASTAVPVDVRGCDGSLKFFHPEGGGWAWTLLLIKFHGQP
ncbi:MAG: hypothetical protein N2322_00755 [Terrimicrobiaceae bacterium]|nr:hypothetical protein [Terrimicrobiaceae bacterium]